ncbi:MAG: Na+/H+ antiporter [uncultured Solirubrobacteraceae bacterium]|uniref:Na+/H+ antiporter n=1 Tax=uncultured Solirubrobacteraceae bacterium TaxID=1162706 RepID=A0A6J4S5K0_9ACTN|nr:MAG: Na+/H+ antiporter [uncultured Solirubrobacteraceae bacterium]
MDDLEFLLVLLLGAAALVRLAERARVPYPIVLVLGGLAVGFLPGLPAVELEPEIVFLVFLPPLLTAAGFAASPQALRAEAGPLGFLTVGLVLLTMGAVAVVAHAVVPGLGWEAAFILGAVVAPTDPVAAAASFSRIGVPERVKLLVEGEAIINDATALVIYRVAVAAAVTGTFSAGDAVLDFVVSAAGGLAVGLAVGVLEVRVLRRLDDTALSIFLTVLFPYGAYISAEQAGASGVLAAVVTGLYLGWFAHDAFQADTRLSATAFWGVLDFAANATLFVLLGLQFPALADELRLELSLGGLVGAAALVSLTVIGVRLLATAPPILGGTARERVAVGWSGMRGAISLAAALAVPTTVEDREVIIFITFVVILVTLVGQGLSLPALLRALGIHGPRPWSPEEAIARLEAAQTALDRLDELEDEGAGEEQLRRLRELYRARFRRCQAVIGGDGSASSAHTETRLRYSALRKELIGVERGALVDLRNRGRLRPELLRVIERDLDLEEARLGAG